MAKHQEKKYRVNSFDKIINLLNEKKAVKGKQITTIHYYAQKEGNDVLKLVKYPDKNEIHILEETGGKFKLTERISMEDVDAGLQWIKNKGHRIVNIVKMVYTQYEYQNGVVGLYTIEDFLHSVILDFPQEQHEAMEKEFELEDAETINVPYNKLLERLGRLRSMEL